MAPERANLVLTTDVPHGEADVLVLDRLDVEADGGDSGDDLTELELVQDGGLAGGVETDCKGEEVAIVRLGGFKFPVRGGKHDRSPVWMVGDAEHREESVGSAHTHQDAHLLLAQELGEYSRDVETHGCDKLWKQGQQGANLVSW